MFEDQEGILNLSKIQSNKKMTLLSAFEVGIPTVNKLKDQDEYKRDTITPSEGPNLGSMPITRQINSNYETSIINS